MPETVGVQRFYLERPVAEDQTELSLPPSLVRQVTTVLRMRVGDALIVFDGSGREWRGSILAIGRGDVRVRLGAPEAPEREATRRVTLCQALLKADKMEWVLQKATELGVARFEPLLTERVVAAKRTIPDRWQRILVEATEQCGRTRVPQVAPPAPIEDALSATPRGSGVFCWEEERDVDLARWLAADCPRELRLFVGPEGGFSEREAKLARDRGATTVSLGARILRAETAAIAASALVLLAPIIEARWLNDGSHDGRLPVLQDRTRRDSSADRLQDRDGHSVSGYRSQGARTRPGDSEPTRGLGRGGRTG